MKKFLVAALLTSLTLNAFAVSEECINLKGDLQTEVGEFHLTSYEKFGAVHFKNKKVELRFVADKDSAAAGGMKLNKHGEYVEPIWPVQFKPIMMGVENFNYIVDQAEYLAAYIRDDESIKGPTPKPTNEIAQYVLFFSTKSQPMYVKGIGKKILNKLNKVEINESNALFISCAKESLQDNISLID